MKSKLLGFISLFVLSLSFLGCGKGPECVYDQDCKGVNSICKDGVCVLPQENKDGGGQVPDIVEHHSECQDGQTRSCYSGDPKTRGIGTCTLGQQKCVDGQWSVCQGSVTPVPEQCDNGHDDDCDGLIDEGCNCNDGETRECYAAPASTKGNRPCKVGQQRCENGKWSDRCVGQILPKREECNGIDDDCNGQIDDDCPCTPGETKSCYNGPPGTLGKGSCKSGLMACLQGGIWGICKNAHFPEKEECNGKDDDCDGVIDNGCDCTPGMTQKCYTGPQGTEKNGICKQGTQLCSKEGTWGPCLGDKKPEKETCNGKDDDCDGQIDNHLQAPDCSKKSGVCKNAKKTCAGEKGWLDCDRATYLKHSPDYELEETKCDGKDNDCDGLVDENIKKPCYTGRTGCTLDKNGKYQCKGRCTAGEKTCQNGAWSQCVGEILPQKESCNGQDSDCNGTIDDGCVCKPGTTRKCYGGPANTAGQGKCKQGIQTCNAKGQWSSCVGEITPKTEQCNGEDDDCNGKIDDGLVGRSCPKKQGVCAGLRYRCAGKAGWVGCTTSDYKKYNALYEEEETSCDGKDNDCDGQVDEGIARPCYNETKGCTKKANGTYVCQGICHTGTQTCKNGQWGSCVGAVGPQKENCSNGKDDDCDGVVDKCGVCQNGQKRTCYTDTKGCIQLPDKTYVCQGPCKTGIQICQNNQWPQKCTGEITPQPEMCNWKDDDCSGKIDDNGACFYTNWNSKQIPPDVIKVKFYDSAHGIAVGRQGNIWNVSNYGLNWTSVTPRLTNEQLNDLAISSNGLVIIVGNKAKILRSTDLGKTYEQVYLGSYSNNLNAVIITQRTNTTGYSIIAVGDKGLVLASKDEGATFKRILLSTNEDLRAIATKPGSNFVVIVGSKGTIFRSNDSGQTWAPQSSNVTTNLNAVTWAGRSDDLLAVGDQGTVLRSSDNGSSWTKMTFNSKINLTNALSPGKDVFIVSGKDSKFYLSVNRGKSFVAKPFHKNETFESLSLRTPTSLVALRSRFGALGEGPVKFLSSQPTFAIRKVTYDLSGSNSIALAIGDRHTFYRSTNSGFVWQQRFIPTSQNVNGIALYDKYALIVGNGGTILRSTDGGLTWKAMKSGTTYDLQDVALYKNGSSYIALAVGTQGVILRSKDAGQTWNPPTAPSMKERLYAVTLRGSIALISGSSGTILRSFDAGLTWKKINSPTSNTLNDIQLHTAGSLQKAIAVGTGGTLLTSTNGGRNWTKVTVKVDGRKISNTFYGTGLSSKKAFVVGTHGLLLESTNPDFTIWKMKTGVPEVRYFSVAYSPKNSYFVIAGEKNTILSSSSQGRYWFIARGVAATYNAITATTSSHFVRVGDMISLSSNNGLSWVYPTNSTQFSTLRGIAYDASTKTLISVGSTAQIHRSTDGGQRWKSIKSPRSNSLYAVASPSRNTFLATGSSALILKSMNGGTSFSSVNSSKGSILRAIDCFQSTCLAVGDKGALFRSTNNGSSWSSLPYPLSPKTSLYAVSFGSLQHVVVAGKNIILYSFDSGSSWKKAKFPENRTFEALKALDDHRFLVADRDGALFLSGDSGKNWSMLAPPVNIPILAVGFDGSTLLFTGSNALVLTYKP